MPDKMVIQPAVLLKLYEFNISRILRFATNLERSYLEKLYNPDIVRLCDELFFGLFNI